VNVRKEKDGRLVIPGEPLSVIEEFMPGPGTYVDEKRGQVKAEYVGRLHIDLKERRIAVKPVAPLRIPQVGRIVVGQVVSMDDKYAMIRFPSGKFTGFFTGVLNISMVSRRFVKSMFDVCRVGDIVRAQIVSLANGFCHLSIIGRHLGVIYANCTQCGKPLELKGGSLYCPRCMRVERRKVALGYGKFRGEFIEDSHTRKGR